MHGEPCKDPALSHYWEHTGQIEVVRHDRTMEQITFPIPEICEFLTPETKHRVFVTAERDDQNSKVTDFFHQHEKLFAEMLWQKKLRGFMSYPSVISCFLPVSLSITVGFKIILIISV